ncbi:hypothetical protein [Longimicrobium sp.]|uniref:hypothetical protein n=1 Tax=Longimicrobium sp. TaxID=2029185 RepID=UPI002E31093A|nr:hypothetical protein [Longimicrobium sp.]HEX6039075.1 hypothetical protein [Longimicrobium sp.]
MAAGLMMMAALPAQAQPCGTRTGGAPTLTAGQTVRGALAREDYTLPGDRYNGTDACTGRPYDSYFYEAQAGEQLTFVLESREIDPEVTATTHWRGGGPKDVVEQRGRRGRTLTATGRVPAAGRILIQVASNVSLGRPGSTGDYIFTVRSNRPGGSGNANGGGGSASGSELRMNGRATGELAAGDRQLADESFYDDYTYRARRGERITVLLSSDDFDAVLHVGRAGGANGTLENVAVDDDGGGGTNSRVEYTADRDGPVVLRVNSLAGGETGRYTLQVQPGGQAPPNNNQGSADESMLTVGRPVQGELTAGGRTLDDGSYYKDYLFQARRGQRVVVRLSSDDFDTVLGVMVLGENGQMQEPVIDDDGGGGTNSRVEYTARRDGPLVVRVNSLSAGETGRYTLVVESARGSAAPRAAAPEQVASADPTPLRLAQAVEGELGPGSARLRDGTPYDLYTYAAHASEALVVRMSSDDFDARLSVTGPTRHPSVTSTVEDDDGGPGTDARAEYRAMAGGPLLIQARAFTPDDAGRYTLIVKPAERPEAANDAEATNDAAPRTERAPAPPAEHASAAPRTSALSAPRFAAPNASASLAAADGRLVPGSALPFAPAVPTRRRMPAVSGGGSGAWVLVALGAGLIFGGRALEKTSAEPLGALIRYTGYAAIAFAPIGA